MLISLQDRLSKEPVTLNNMNVLKLNEGKKTFKDNKEGYLKLDLGNFPSFSVYLCSFNHVASCIVDWIFLVFYTLSQMSSIDHLEK